MNAIRIGCLALLVVTSGRLSIAQQPTSRQKREVKLLARRIDKAGRLYQARKYESAADEIGEAQDKLLELAATADGPLMQLIQPQYDRLSKAHRLLKEQGLEIRQLLPLPEPLSSDLARISFRQRIAPLLVTHCGRCHVDQSRGDFSANSYIQLMASQHVVPSRPDASRLVEIIADKEMPPEGSVPEQDLQDLKWWIRQGAGFDGENPGVGLRQLGSNNPSANPDLNGVALTRPQGNETVSFGQDIAPILLKNCRGCHIDGRRDRGNFNMNNFARFLRGGDSGSPIQPGVPGQSLIVQRLRGRASDIMPPGGKLSDEQIALVEKWIAEGGAFDGGSPQTELATVASFAKSKALDHQSLSQDRDQLSVRNWKLIMSDIEPETTSNANFRVIGTNPDNRLQTTAELATRLSQQITDYLRSDPEQPFIKGKTTIYLFERRYDLNELGMMLMGHGLPKKQTGRWDYTPVDVYASLLLPRGESPEVLQADLAQQLAATHIASWSEDIPRWFADGVGYLTAARIIGKDPRVSSWQVESKAIVNSLDQPFAFATGQLNELDAGLAGYAYVQHLKESGDLKRLLKLIRDGQSFNTAFADRFGSEPDDFFKQQGTKRRR